MLQAEQRLPRGTAKAKRSFPVERGSIAKHHRPAWNPPCTQSRGNSSALHRKSCHASVSVILERRGGCCHIDGPIRVLSCQMRHTIAANQGRVVSLSALSLLSACVRLRQLREVHHNLQQALNPCSQKQSAATDGSPACCTSLMLRLCVILRVPSQSSVHRCLCCCCANSGACLVWRVLFGAL